jgi:hypothetical protein
VQNQLGRAKAPRASWSKAGCTLANNRSFTDSILNNTPPALGSKVFSPFDPFHSKFTFAVAKRVDQFRFDLGRGNLKVSLQLNYRLR